MPRHLCPLTPEEIKQDADLIQTLAEDAGGMSQLARDLKISRITLYDWRQKGFPPQFHRLIAMVQERERVIPVNN